MKHWKRTSFCLATASVALTIVLGVVLIHAAEKSNGDAKQFQQRLFKFKTSDPNGINFAAQIKFQPGDLAKMRITLESGNTTNRIEFRVKSDMTVDPPHHFIEGHFTQQIGKAKPEILRRPMLRTHEGFPTEVQINEFHFDVLIEPVN